MAITRREKEVTLAALQEKLQRAKSIIFTHYQGLTVKEVTELRRTLRQDAAELVVIKKTLLRRALSGAGQDSSLAERLVGSVALAFGYSDEVSPARILQKFAKTHPVVELLSAVVAGQTLDALGTVALATLPSRDELRAKMVWILGSPLSGSVNVLAGTLRGFINVLNAIKEKSPAPAAA